MDVSFASFRFVQQKGIAFNSTCRFAAVNPSVYLSAFVPFKRRGNQQSAQPAWPSSSSRRGKASKSRSAFVSRPIQRVRPRGSSWSRFLWFLCFLICFVSFVLFFYSSYCCASFLLVLCFYMFLRSSLLLCFRDPWHPCLESSVKVSSLDSLKSRLVRVSIFLKNRCGCMNTWPLQLLA